MGCSFTNICTKSQNRFESIIDEAFADEIIRKISFKEILQELDQLEESKLLTTKSKSNTLQSSQLNYLKETNFQSFVNKFLLSETTYDYNRPLYKFWMNVYTVYSYSINMQLPIIKFTLLCLTKSSSENRSHPCGEDYVNFTAIFNLFKQNKFSIDNDETNSSNTSDINIITVDDVFSLLKEYLKIITIMTIDFFKDFHENPEEFRIHLSSLWTNHVINEFVKTSFFEKIESFSMKVDVRKFVKKNWNLLKDDALMRKRLSEFAVGMGSKKEGGKLYLTESDSRYKIE
jgi:hypothetical protein